MSLENPPLKSRHRRLLVGTLIAAVLCGVALVVAIRAGSNSSIPTINIPAVQQAGFVPVHNRVAPTFDLASVITGQPEVRLPTTGARPTVVNFWSSTCPPCRQEMPAIADVAQQLTGRVGFIGVDTLDVRSAAAGFAAGTGAHYPLGFDSTGSTANRYGVSGLPTTFFITAGGQVVGMNLGAMTEPELLGLVHELFRS